MARDPEPGMPGGTGDGARRIAVLYHSGSGGTRMLAELVGEGLSRRGEVDVASVEDPRALDLARGAAFLVLLHPTYFLRPSPSMMEFIAALGPFSPPRPAYVVATYELYPENAIRAASKALAARGAVVVGSKALRSPGSDVTCVLPAGLVPWLYRFERRMPEKLGEIISEVEALALEARAEPAAPAPKWYTPFAQALQVLALNHFLAYRDKFRVLPERCVSCGACVGLCGRGAWAMTDAGPVHDGGRCELCTRCVHRCPRRAIVLVRALRDNPRLDARLYASLESEARRAAGLRGGAR